ncbi:MAG: hypothetical protein QXF26_01660 [Candidatus Bathyarchaeia archaeon]
MSTTKPLSDRLEELDELFAELEAQRALIDNLRKEARTWKARRDGLNAKNRKIWQEVKELRNKRDGFNEEIKKLKEEKARIYEQTNMKREELEVLRRKMNVLLGKTSLSKIGVIKRIHELDWEIQTNPLTLLEEKAIIEQIKELEEQAVIHKEAGKVRDRILELRAELVSMRLSASRIQEKVTQLVQQSQSCHEEMVAKAKQTEEVKAQADEAHRQYMQILLQLEEAEKISAELYGRIQAIRDAIKKDEQDEAKRRLEKLIVAESEAALRKLKERKKVTLEEFKILKSKGLI